jgi:phosphoribosylanthranilate isomerase
MYDLVVALEKTGLSKLNLISQFNSSNKDFWKDLYCLKNIINHNILFDSSGGKGIKISDNLPIPINGILCGYSGGLGPDNISTFLTLLEKTISDGITWIDMETNIRTDDKLDLDKVEYVLSQTHKYTGGGIIVTRAKGGFQNFVY